MSMSWPPRRRGTVLRFRPKARRRTNWARYVPLWAGAALIGGAYGGGWLDGMRLPAIAPAQAIASTPGERAIRASFGFCHTGGGTNCVVDGDTLWLGGQKIRVADIDAPETHGPRCAAEARLGAAA